MKNQLFVIAVAVILFVIPMQAQADVIFSDFGTSPGYNNGDGLLVTTYQGGSTWQADGFTPTANYNLTTIEVALSRWAHGSNTATVWLEKDNGGTPAGTGSAIETYSLTGLPNFGSSGPFVTGTSLLKPLLAAGQQYWLVAYPTFGGSRLVWNQNDNNYSGPTYASSSGTAGSWGTGNSPSLFGAMRISGDPVAHTSPEPASMLLFGFGGLAMAAFKRRKK